MTCTLLIGGSPNPCAARAFFEAAPAQHEQGGFQRGVKEAELQVPEAHVSYEPLFLLTVNVVVPHDTCACMLWPHQDRVAGVAQPLALCPHKGAGALPL